MGTHEDGDAEQEVQVESHEPLSSASFRNVYFTQVALKGIRCFRHAASLSLLGRDAGPARWTLILGANGTGKTTLLQIIASLQFFGRGRQNSERSPLFFAPGVVRPHEAAPALTIGTMASTSFADESRASAWYRFVYESNGVVRGSGPKERTIAFGYGARRFQGPPGITATASSDPAATLFDDAATLRNPEEWLLQTVLVASKSADDIAARRFERMRAVLTRVLPDVSDVRVATTSSIEESPRAFVEVCGPDGWIPFSALGLGYRTMTAWMVDFASRLFERYPDLPDPLAGPAVCLVDEIDLHLHPTWQRSLISHLTELFPQTQFIATAHSPLVVQSARDANIVVLRREGDHVVIDDAHQSVRNWRVDQILTSDLFGVPSGRPPELDALFRERDEILGKSELTADDQTRLKELRDAIGVIPYGDSPRDIEAMDVLRRAAMAVHDKP